MTLNERGLTLLACKYVDELILGTPWETSKELIDQFKISVVFVGQSSDPAYRTDINNGCDAAIELNIFRVLESDDNVQTSTIIQRIQDNKSAYIERQRRKEEKEKLGFS